MEVLSSFQNCFGIHDAAKWQRTAEGMAYSLTVHPGDKQKSDNKKSDFSLSFSFKTRSAADNCTSESQEFKRTKSNQPSS